MACETLISQLGIESMTLALETQSLNHWIAREVQASHLKELKDPGTRFPSYCWDSSIQPSQKQKESWKVAVDDCSQGSLINFCARHVILVKELNEGL